MHFKKYVIPTRNMLSSYYISLLFATLIFRLQPFNTFILSVQDFVQASMTRILNTDNANTTTIVWFSLVVVCFLVVFLIKIFIVDPVGLSIQDETGMNIWEKIILSCIIIGAFLYYVNDYFSVAMPSEFAPIIRQFFGDKMISGIDAMRIAAFVWNILPLMAIFVITKIKTAAPAPAAH